MSENNNIIKIDRVSKKFGGTIALNEVSFCIKKGEVHAIVGENGAGKSTLMKILSGVQVKDSGKIYIKDLEMNVNNPLDAKNAGISMVFQELNNFPDLSVFENIFMTRELKSKTGLLNNRNMINRSVSLLNSLATDHEISPTETLGKLTVADQQMVEIVKALSFGSEIIILDEPNSALSESESRSLFKLIKALKAKGITIIYVSHRLEEVFAIADRITVLRDGNYINTWNIAETNVKEVINTMIGRKLEEVFPPRRDLNKDAKVVLQLKNLSKKSKLHSIDFTLHQGEVLGFAGLEGCGIDDIFKIIFGLEKKDSGEIIFEGKLQERITPWGAIKKRWAMVPAERHLQGLMTSWSVNENITFVVLSRLLNSIKLINNKAARKLSTKFVKKLNIATSNIFKTVIDLSGGNQQKVAISKWLASEPKLIILNDPTRGIDVGAKAEIYKLVDNLAREGHAILFTSSEIEETLELCDNIIVIYDGEIVGKFEGDKVDKKQLTSYVTGSFEGNKKINKKTDQ